MTASKFTIACLTLAPVLLAGDTVASDPARSHSTERQVAETVSENVWCYDEERELVSRRPAWRCAGRVVDEETAQKVRLQRVRRIQGQIKKPEPLFKGRRLRGTGTGFFITHGGYILTNWHVVDNCKGISFTPAGGNVLVAELMAHQSSKDLALLRAPYSPADVVSFRSARQPEPMEELFVIGYPLHGKVTIKPILKSGFMADKKPGARPGKYSMKIDIRRGNSGGPVLDRAGRLMGVVVAKVNTPGYYAVTGRLVRNVGYAIHLSVVRDFLRNNDISIREASMAPPLSDTELFDKAHKFVGQVGCWR